MIDGRDGRDGNGGNGGNGGRERPGPMSNGADGGSAERTRLAWRRTVLATTGVTLLTIRVAVRGGVSVGSGLAIAAAALGWLASLWLSQRRVRAMAAKEPRNIGRTLPAVALLIVGFAVLGIVLVAVTDSSVR